MNPGYIISFRKEEITFCTAESLLPVGSACFTLSFSFRQYGKISSKKEETHENNG